LSAKLTMRTPLSGRRALAAGNLDAFMVASDGSRAGHLRPVVGP
jgi:hypothetical protein